MGNEKGFIIVARSKETLEIVCVKKSMQEIVDALCEVFPDASPYVARAKRRGKSPLVQLTPFLDYYDIEIKEDDGTI